VLKVYIGVVRLPDNRDFIIMVDGEPQPVQDSVMQVISEIYGDGDVSRMNEGVDFTEYLHQRHQGQTQPDGYVLGCEVGSLKRMGFAIQYARRLRNLGPVENT
jgi:hypothetical protein